MCRLFLLLLSTLHASRAGLLAGDGVIINTGVSPTGAVLGAGAADTNWRFAGPGPSRFPADYGAWAPATTQGTAPGLDASRGLAGIAVQPTLATYGLYWQTFTA